MDSDKTIAEVQMLADVACRVLALPCGNASAELVQQADTFLMNLLACIEFQDDEPDVWSNN